MSDGSVPEVRTGVHRRARRVGGGRRRREKVLRRLELALATLAVATAAVPAQASSAASEVEPQTLARAQVIRAEIDARYRLRPGRKLTVTEATSTGVVESFTLLTADFIETRIVAADNGIYYAICPRRATCPYPARRFARPAAEFLPRRLALELALRTFLETSASVVAVSLPTPRFVLFIAERAELAREVDMPALAKALSGDPAHPPAAWLQRAVEEVTRPRVFVSLGLEPTPGNRDTIVAMPRWPPASVVREESAEARPSSISTAKLLESPNDALPAESGMGADQSTRPWSFDLVMNGVGHVAGPRGPRATFHFGFRTQGSLASSAHTLVLPKPPRRR